MSLSESTYKQYEGRVNKIRKHITPNILDIESYFDELDAFYPNIQTRKGAYAALLWKLGTYTSDTAKDVRLAVQKKFDELKKECNKQTISQELTPSQLALYMPYPDLVALAAKANSAVDWEKGEYTDNLLYYTIIALYVYQPPVRADYWGMDIVEYWPENDYKHIPDIHSRVLLRAKSHMTEPDKNFCIVTPTDTYFVFNCYKTAKTYGQQVVKAEWVVHHLIKHIHHNLKCWEVLPIKTPNSLVKYVKQAFASVGGKEITIGLLRHAYIVEFYKSNPSIAKKEELARKMLHSRSIQECYRSENVDSDDI